MKRLLSVLVVVCLCCGLAVGCSGKADVTKLPHNSKLSITDKKADIQKVEELNTKDEISYTTKVNCEIDGNKYSVTYQFSNLESDKDYIGSIKYESKDVQLQDAQKYINSVYGDLDKDTTEGKYSPGEDGRYIIENDGKVWTVGCLSDTYNGGVAIIISRDATLE